MTPDDLLYVQPGTPDRLLFEEHRYEEAIVAFGQLYSHKGGAPLLANRAWAFLCVGRLSEALDDLQTAHRFAAEEHRHPMFGGEKVCGTYLDTIAAIYWMLGNKTEAYRTIRASTDGILDGSIHYADLAAGASQGLLLWYFAVTDGDVQQGKYVQRYFSRLAKRKSRIGYWPGPVALFLLGKTQCADVLNSATGHNDLAGSLIKAETDVLARRQLVQALFYLGIKARERGDEAECRSLLVRCIGLQNPIIEDEWYLAWHEIASRDLSKNHDHGEKRDSD
ncbi:MAG: hypothetical protein HY719_02125 [Planctomycetes bacterium]|nr:hypothetical protein [Planctomycetota bacterium]